MRYLELLTEHLKLDSPEFRQWFGNSKVVDAHGNPLPVYHGTARPDRVGTRFRKTRATAGPMAYFTDSPEIASGYATSKPDSSIGDEDIHYPMWFKVRVGRSEVDIVRLWYFLPPVEREELAERAPHITRDDDGNILFDAENHRGLGSYDYNLKLARGNVLQAMVEDWITSGALNGDEESFLTVLRLAGLKQPVRFDSPNATYPFVYQVFLSIQHPLVSTNIPKEVLDALANRAKRLHNRGNPYGSWDKTNVDPKQWIRNLLDDVESTGGRMSWTVIPDWVVQVLKAFGYDGIQDVGGKSSDKSHTVWIPFEETQVKSAISNRKFRANSSNIHK